MINKQKIGDFLKRIKRPLQLSADKEYKLVTIKMNHKGVVLRGLKKGGDIKSNMYEVKQGDFILSGIDARNGAFGIVPAELDGAIVTNDFWYFEIDEAIINKALFLELTSTVWFDDICKRGSDGTTQRIRLQKNKFFNQEIYLPLPDRQQDLLTKIQSIKTKQVVLHQQAIEQQGQVNQLKQAILHEAIQGKLTESWRVENPDVEPGSRLLEKIALKRKDWIEDNENKEYKEAKTISKKLKNLEKSNLKTPDIPIPNNWVWAPILKISQLVVDCHNKTAPYVDSGIPLIRTTNIRNAKIDLLNTKYVTKETYLFWSKRCIPVTGDILFTREAPVGEGAIIPSGITLCMGQRVMLIRLFNEYILRDYLLLVITSPDFIFRISKERKGAMVGHLRVGDVENFHVPIPPFEEQYQIVIKTNLLLKKCVNLESEIKQSEIYAEQFMQAVIKEAFEPETNKEIN